MLFLFSNYNLEFRPYLQQFNVNLLSEWRFLLSLVEYKISFVIVPKNVCNSIESKKMYDELFVRKDHFSLKNLYCCLKFFTKPKSLVNIKKFVMGNNSCPL